MGKWKNGITGENIMILSLSQDIWPDNCESDCHFKVRLKTLALYKLQSKYHLISVQDTRSFTILQSCIVPVIFVFSTRSYLPST